MPTNKYKSIDEAYQALLDLEIVDDENNFPIAKIKVPGMHTITIQMVSEYDYFYVLCPMREKFLTYWVNKIAIMESETDTKKLTKKIEAIVSDIESVRNPKDLNEKSSTLAYLFEDEKIRYAFFKDLKRMKIIKWWVSWKRQQKTMTPLQTIAVFIYLWLFNFDGVKKNVKLLLAKIGATTNLQSSTISTNYGNWESYKQRLEEAHKRNLAQSEHLKN